MAEGGSQDRTLVSGVAGRYATALFELASEANAIDAVAADLERFTAVSAESADLRRLIESPAFSAEEQVKAIGAVLASVGIAGIAANFIGLVASKRRLFAPAGHDPGLPQHGRRVQGHRARRGHGGRGPLRPARRGNRAALTGVAGKDVDVSIKVDPALIGGLVVKMGSRMVDASLKTKLNSIRLAMKEVG